MSFDINGTRLLMNAARSGVDFSRTAMLGRQTLNLNSAALRQNLVEFGYNADAQSLLQADNGYAESFLRMLGANEIASFDASGYEAATYVHDFNLPVSPIHHQSFTALIDGGTLEHVFNFPVGLRSAMEMVELGGHFLSLTPANNAWGHGFYQFSPDLFIRAFSPENGFRLDQLMAYETDSKAWYELQRMSSYGYGISTRKQIYLFVVAKRISLEPLFANPVYQPVYSGVWAASRTESHDGAYRSWRQFVPEFLKIPIRSLRRLRTKSSQVPRLPSFFRKITLQKLSLPKG